MAGVGVRLEGHESFSSVSVQTTLNAHAAQLLTLHGSTAMLPTVRLDDSWLGSFIVGDRLSVVGTHGFLDLEGEYRVTGWSASLADGSPALVDVNLAPLEMFRS